MGETVPERGEAGVEREPKRKRNWERGRQG